MKNSPAHHVSDHPKARPAARDEFAIGIGNAFRSADYAIQRAATVLAHRACCAWKYFQAL